MATFELNGDMLNRSPKQALHTQERFEKNNSEKGSEHERTSALNAAEAVMQPELRPVKQENIIALKIYDSCRQQDCLDGNEMGPARSAGCQELDGKHYRDGEIIDPPRNAASVSIDCLRIKKIMIVNKRHNPFKRGFWDIDLKYVFEYCLCFREAGGDDIGSLKANSIFNKKVTLFGSIGSDIVISTDLLYDRSDESPALSLDPFVLVEAKAITIKRLQNLILLFLNQGNRNMKQPDIKSVKEGTNLACPATS